MDRVQVQSVKSRALHSYKPKFFYQMKPHARIPKQVLSFFLSDYRYLLAIVNGFE